MSAQQEFIYVLRATRLAMLTEGPNEHESAVLERHTAHLAQLAQDWVVILAGRTTEDDERTFGVVIFRASDSVEADQIMNNDPAIHERVMTATLQPFRVVLGGG